MESDEPGAIAMTVKYKYYLEERTSPQGEVLKAYEAYGTPADSHEGRLKRLAHISGEGAAGHAGRQGRMLRQSAVHPPA